LNNTKNYHFLLGGYDLEMAEIKTILKEHHQTYSDKHLAWGAALDDYEDILQLNPDNHFVGIELIIKNPSLIPVNYTEIDHHNEKAHLPSSIEQLAHLLGITLNYHQQLVAANDKGYIPTMKAIGASPNEIQHIRWLDRQAQGITPEMEEMALEAIQKGEEKNGVSVVFLPLNKYSPVVDRLNVEKLLVYSPKSLNYYGKYASQLAILFADDVAHQKAYYGGGSDGYFGFAAGVFSLDEIENYLIPKILQHVGDS